MTTVPLELKFNNKRGYESIPSNGGEVYMNRTDRTMPVYKVLTNNRVSSRTTCTFTRVNDSTGCYEVMEHNGSGIDKYRCYPGDAYATELKVQKVVKSILKDAEKGEHVLDYTASSELSSSPQKGLIEMTQVDGDLAGLNKMCYFSDHQIRSVLKQLSECLVLLTKEARFSHNDLKLKNVFYTIRQDDTTSRWTPVIKLGDFDKSSIMDDKGFYYNVKTNGYKKVVSAVAPYLFASAGTSRLVTPDSGVYTIEASDKRLVYNASRHSGAPYYRSYDWYVFVTSMLLDKSWYLRCTVDILDMLRNTTFRDVSTQTRYLKEIVKMHATLVDSKLSKVSTAIDVLLRVRVPMYCDALIQASTYRWPVQPQKQIRFILTGADAESFLPFVPSTFAPVIARRPVRNDKTLLLIDTVWDTKTPSLFSTYEQTYMDSRHCSGYYYPLVSEVVHEWEDPQTSRVRA